MEGLGNHIVQASGATTAMSVRLGELMLETTPDKLLALLKFLRGDAKSGPQDHAGRDDDARELAVALIAAYEGIALLAATLRDPGLIGTEGGRLERWIDSLAGSGR